MPVPGCVLLVHLGLNPHRTSLFRVLLEGHHSMRFTTLWDWRRQELSFEWLRALSTLLSRPALRVLRPRRVGRVAL
jgi:hypothetical protein